MVDNQVKQVILYRYLPSLWAEEPIPDSLREFWYTNRPDILKYMKKNYSQLEIDFEPNRVLKEMYEKGHGHVDRNIVENILSIKQLSTNIICDISSNSHYSIDHFVSSSNHFISVILDQNII